MLSGGTEVHTKASSRTPVWWGAACRLKGFFQDMHRASKGVRVLEIRANSGTAEDLDGRKGFATLRKEIV